MRVLKSLLAATCATLIGTAGTAHADIDPDDDSKNPAFLQALQDVGIEYSSADQVTTSGKGVCSYLAQGHTPNETAQTIENENPKLSPKQALQFLVIARGAYCPLPTMGGGGGG